MGELPLSQESVIAYLRSLRDAAIATWRRHQAARALEIYQATVPRNSIVDFRPIRNKLQEIARTEKRTGGVTSAEAALVDGKGNAGFIRHSEPEAIERMRARMRVSHHPIGTEQEHLCSVEAVHQGDLQDGCGEVNLPFALARKYPNAARQFGWQYVFPSPRLSRDPRSGNIRRHHLHESTFDSGYM